MTELWLIEPRDPLVLGDGRGFGSHAPGAFLALPLPGTVAGMVRSWFVRGQSQVTKDKAAELLQIQIRGPWLVHRDAEGKVEHLFPVGSDVLCDKARKLHIGKARRLRDDEGILWQKGAPAKLWPVELQERADDEKLQRPDPSHWPLGALVELAVGPPESAAAPKLLTYSATAPELLTYKETRTHVVIEPKSGTAAPGQLFTSGGVRFREGLALAVEVTAPEPADAGLLVLGGESRLSFLSTGNDSFPVFAKFKDRYQDAVNAGRSWLRMQLLTPAYLPDGPADADAGWLPRWLDHDLQGEHPNLPGVRLQLRAVCLGRAMAISGWDLQAADGRGAPREVRRLAPAGTVYYFELPQGANALDACEALWGQTLDPVREGEGPDMLKHRAPAAWDGYGLLLPGLWRPKD